MRGPFEASRSSPGFPSGTLTHRCSMSSSVVRAGPAPAARRRIVLHLWRRRGAAVGLAALATLAAACGGAAESGVNVKTVATDLTYGIPEEPKTAAPANTDPTPTDPLGTVNKGGDFKSKPIRIPTRETSRELCPKTPPTVFPPPAPTKIAGSPKKGEYLWNITGKQLLPELATTIQLPKVSTREVTESGVADGGPRFTVSE